MDNKSVRPVYCLLAGALSLLLFPAVSLAASIDTDKIQPKVANVPVQAPPVKLTPPEAPLPDAPIVLTMTHTASPPPQAPKAVVNTPTYNVRPKTQVKLPTRTVTPKVNIKTPVRTRPIQESAVKVLPPPNPPTRPQMQPGVNLKRPLGQVPPMSAGNYPPPWPPLNKPAQQPGFSVKRPENFAPRNLPRSQKGQILDPRYAPPLPGPSRIGSGRGRGRGNGYYSDDGYGRHYYGRTAYNPATQRLPANAANPAIPLPNTAPAQISKQPRAQSKLNVSTPGGANGIGGSRVDRQTLDRIQGIQEAATAAQVFKQLEELKKAEDLQKFGAAKRGFGGDQAGPLGDGGIGLGAVSGEGDSSRSQSRNEPGMRVIGGSSNADPAAGSGSAAPGSGLDRSRLGWVLTDTTETGKDESGAWSRTTTTDSDGNTTSVQIRETRSTPGMGEGSSSVHEEQATPDGGGYSIVTTYAPNGLRYGDSVETTYRVVEGVIKSTTTAVDVDGNRRLMHHGSGRPGFGGSQSETTGDKKFGDCVKGAGGCAKKTRTKPMDTVTLPSKGDADTDPGSSPIIGAAAVTNEDEFHSLSAGSGGGGGGDVLTQPPTEGAEGGGSTPPPPTPGGG